ncbi:hypothetical protein SAMN04488144_13445 [Methylobacterium sp. 190mf]|nr:hypothetical protein SAMN04488144_13445 [Methylobacterium sp. 190mf]
MSGCKFSEDARVRLSSAVRPTTSDRFRQCREAADEFGTADPVAMPEHDVQPRCKASPSRPMNPRSSFGINLQPVVAAHPELQRLDGADRLPRDPIRREASVINPLRTNGDDHVGLEQLQAPHKCAKAEDHYANAHLIIPEAFRNYGISADIRLSQSQPKGHCDEHTRSHKARKNARIGSVEIDCAHWNTPSLEYSAYASLRASEVRRSTDATAASGASHSVHQLSCAGLHCGG